MICPKCGSNNVSFKRERQGEFKTKKNRQIIMNTVAICQNCGNTWVADTNMPVKKKNNMVWWVLGWIFFFPIPLGILIYRFIKKYLDSNVEIQNNSVES